jgi:hypothetical protein
LPRFESCAGARRDGPPARTGLSRFAFGAQAHDPFSPSYPGYITIQRFADLAAAHLHDATRVLDLGCGPGEDLTVRNSSWREWRSEPTPHPILLSYHWLDASRGPVEYDGLRTPLPRPLPPGEACAVTMRARAPAKPGRYVLEIDLVEEGVSRFTRAGTRPLRRPVRVM